MSKFSILIIDDSRLNSPPCSSSISKKLCRTTTVHNPKLRNCFIHSPSQSQKTVILENNSVIIAESLCNAITFLFTKNNTTAPGGLAHLFECILVNCVMMPKSTCVLSRNIQFDTQCTESFASNTMCMTCSDNVRSRL